MFERIAGLDQELEQYIYLHRPGGAEHFMMWMTNNATIITFGFVGLLLILYFIKRQKKYLFSALNISLVIGISALITGTLKVLLTRARPYKVLDSISTPIIESGGYSFPSGHTTEAFALATTVFLITRNPWLRLIALVWAVFIAYTRMALGVHFPVDILGGILVGSLTAVFWMRWKPFDRS